ncbi:MAG: hypothetical protein ACYDB2_02750 [Acidimicrobiales bacterium]
MTSRSAGEGRYAVLEREQRWILDAVPTGITDERTVTDHYLIGTTLRLRKLQSANEILFKLCQKVRVEEGNPERVKITNIYISPEEYDQIRSLPSSTIVKTRHNYLRDDVVYAIDQFRGRHVGLVLAETELSESDLSYPVPAFGWLEVTRDDRYSGGSLAVASDEDLRELIGR